MAMLEYKRALYDFSAAIRAEGRQPNGGMNSSLAEYYMYAGQCNQMLGQYEEALAHYQIGINKQSDYGEIYFHRGLANVSLTKFNEGITDFQEALANLKGS